MAGKVVGIGCTSLEARRVAVIGCVVAHSVRVLVGCAAVEAGRVADIRCVAVLVVGCAAVLPDVFPNQCSCSRNREWLILRQREKGQIEREEG